jgi:hypothetical protein
MGVVYEVRHPNAPRSLALKPMHCGGAASEIDLERFRREADILLRIRHPNVVTVHERGDSPHGLYLVSDLVEGNDLKVMLRTGPLPPLRSAQIVRELAGAVQALHDNHVLHRDLKPENVIVRPDGTPILLDFGVARDLKAESLTATGQLLGSPAFMSPEQADGDKTLLGPHTDVYGLGSVLFTLLSGRYPHAGGSLASTLKMILVDEPQWPSTDHPATPRALEEICKRAMAKEPHERYPTAQALEADLQRFLDGLKTQESQSGSPKSTGRALVIAGLALLTAIVGIAVSGGIAIGRRSASVPEAPSPVAAQPAADETPAAAPKVRASWTQIAPTAPGQGPGTKNLWQSMVYVPEREGMVLYGGQGDASTPRTHAALTSLWLWKDGRWEPLEGTDVGSSLGVRTAGGMVYDEDRNLLLRYGGLKHPENTNRVQNRQDLWVGNPDGTTKDFVEFQDPTQPTSRSYHGMAWDPSRRAVAVVGGLKNSFNLDVKTKPRYSNAVHYRAADNWETLKLDEGPSPRARHALGYDRKRKRLVLFGGRAGKNMNDLWELKGTTRWKEIDFKFEGETPPGDADGFLNGASFVFNTEIQELILHGGEAAGKPLRRTYLYDGTRFKEIAATGPRADYSAFAWDPKRKVAVLHGPDGTWELTITGK